MIKVINNIPGEHHLLQCGCGVVDLYKADGSVVHIKDATNITLKNNDTITIEGTFVLPEVLNIGLNHIDVKTVVRFPLRDAYEQNEAGCVFAGTLNVTFQHSELILDDEITMAVDSFYKPKYTIKLIPSIKIDDIVNDAIYEFAPPKDTKKD